MSTCEHVGFFYAHRYHLADVGKVIAIYETHSTARYLIRHSGCHPEQYSNASAGLNHLLEQRVWQPFFSAIALTSVSYMKKKLTAGANSLPAVHEINFVSKIRELVNRSLPSECQIQTTQDAWYVGAIGALCVTFLFPPAVAVAAYCVYRAKKEGGGR